MVEGQTPAQRLNSNNALTTKSRNARQNGSEALLHEKMYQASPLLVNEINLNN